MLFQLCGFIPVEMVDNGSGTPNKYNRSSFKTLLKQVKQSFAQGFDILIFAEGQLNPWPEKGVLPVFTGAQKLSLMSGRPMHLVALSGCQNLWRAPVHNENLMQGMHVTGRHVKVRGYSCDRQFSSDDEFVQTFSTVVGHFGATGHDVRDLAAWLDGSAYQNSLAELSVDDPSADMTDSADVEQVIAKVLERESRVENKRAPEQQSSEETDQMAI